jgi:hypothetical protein
VLELAGFERLPRMIEKGQQQGHALHTEGVCTSGQEN